MTTFSTIENKWQKLWDKHKVFEPEINNKNKFFVTFPYPYVNGSGHLGHLYTITKVEVFARYKRAQGYNVLFPLGWHCTGSPIVAAANRVKEKEPLILEILKKEGFEGKEAEKFSKPENWINVFSKKWEKDIRGMGFSIDWRRNFITTSLNPYYDKFIEWQFRKLKSKNLIGIGKHPVVWDPKTNMPVGDHDRIKGEGEVPQEFILIKHYLCDNNILVSATLRSDTILGITNLFVNPELTYEITNVNSSSGNSETWIISSKAVKNLQEQGWNIEIKGKISGSELIGKKSKEFDGSEVLILPASFIDENLGTGIVHSVPSDSADDLIALKDLQNNERLLTKFNLNKEEVKSIKPIPVLNTPDYGDIPAEIILNKYKIKSQSEKDKLETAKKELYKLSYYSATFNDKYKKVFSINLLGKKVEEGKDVIKKELVERGWAETYYQLSGEVISRSLSKCIVKIVDNQWFIKYSNKIWKDQAHKALSKTKLYPEDVRDQFNKVIDWLDDWACTREYGLGTRLPFDDKWLIESLSDSTIYMAYYTIAHQIKKMNLNEINDYFFDYVLLNKGKGKKSWKKLKEEFEYWYPVDFRNSGKDLVQNHLTFFLFNHIALFPKKYWPKSIGVNGFVRVDGEKMSKSIGNVIPISKINSQFGADASRLTIMNGGESLDDPNWDSKLAENLTNKFEHWSEFIIRNYNKGGNKITNLDKWMLSKLNQYGSEINQAMEQTLFRTAIQKIYFEFITEIKWYLKRTSTPNKKILNQVLDTLLLFMQPITPHLAEELWHKIGKKTFISLEKWPTFKPKKFVDTEVQIKNLIKDTSRLVQLVKNKPTKAFIYVIPTEFTLYNEALDFLNKELKLNFTIYKNNDKKKYDPLNKAIKAQPNRPSLFLE